MRFGSGIVLKIKVVLEKFGIGIMGKEESSKLESDHSQQSEKLPVIFICFTIGHHTVKFIHQFCLHLDKTQKNNLASNCFQDNMEE